MFTFRSILTAICCLLLGPRFTGAAEREKIGSSVQAIQIQYSAGARLSSKAEWSLQVVDMGTGKSLMRAANVTSPLIPGSLMKLFVTAAILEENSREAIDLGTVVELNGVVNAES